ncbi:MAG TPA: HipA domain-containing protein, partial [Azonexus sp.]|nr:HipA domain-containing protein [Azonexus sp.]
ALLWAFGTLIGNTDMHAGNLSFVSRHGRPYQLAPAYDVLPMSFAPRAGGALVDTLAPAALIATVDADTWRQALQLAEHFFARLSDTAAFSPRFQPCIAALDRHIDEAARRIARLG